MYRRLLSYQKLRSTIKVTFNFSKRLHVVLRFAEEAINQLNCKVVFDDPLKF